MRQSSLPRAAALAGFNPEQIIFSSFLPGGSAGLSAALFGLGSSRPTALGGDTFTAQNFLFGPPQPPPPAFNPNALGLLNQLFQNFAPAAPPAGFGNFNIPQFNPALNAPPPLAQPAPAPMAQPAPQIRKWNPDGGNKDFVTTLYHNILGRPPESQQVVDTWAAHMEQNGVASLLKGFFNSEEFKAKNLPPDQVIELLYHAILGRPSDPEGKAFWLNALMNGQSLDSIIDAFVNSEEYQNNVRLGLAPNPAPTAAPAAPAAVQPAPAPAAPAAAPLTPAAAPLPSPIDAIIEPVTELLEGILPPADETPPTDVPPAEVPPPAEDPPAVDPPPADAEPPAEPDPPAADPPAADDGPIPIPLAPFEGPRIMLA